MKRKRKMMHTTFRCRKRVRVRQWIALNVSRQGLSVSIGRRGFMLNLGRRGVYVTLSARGTGMSYRIGTPWGNIALWMKKIFMRNASREMYSPHRNELRETNDEMEDA